MIHHNEEMLKRLLPSSSSCALVPNFRKFCIEPKTKRGSRKIHDHFERSGQTTNLNLFPADSKRVTRKKNQPIHVANEQAAQQIAKLISRFYKKNVPFVELSPGPCILSKALLNQMDMETLVLIQMDKEFAPIQQVWLYLQRERFNEFLTLFQYLSFTCSNCGACILRKYI